MICTQVDGAGWLSCDLLQCVCLHSEPRITANRASHLENGTFASRQRSRSSTLQQLRQHESPFLVRSSRSRAIVWNTRVRTLRTAHWNTDCNWSPEKKAVYQGTQLNNGHKRAWLSGLLLPSSIRSAKCLADLLHTVSTLYDCHRQITAIQIEEIHAKVTSQTCIPTVPGWNLDHIIIHAEFFRYLFSVFPHKFKERKIITCFDILRVHQISPLKCGKPNKTN